MAISIIVPIYNENTDTLARLTQNLQAQQGEFEVIFVDSSEEAHRILSANEESFDRINLSSSGLNFTLIHSPKGRGMQQNLGAKRAKFDKLLFLHADSAFERDDAILAADEALEIFEAGCFKLKFDSSELAMKIVAFMSNLRVKFREIAFGDQGIFMTKRLFERLTGFADIPIMEDYELSLRLKKEGVKFKQLNVQITTSARKFELEGVLKTIIKMQILQRKFRKGISANDIAKSY